MAIMRSLKPIAALLCAAVLTSCDLFDENAVQDITAPNTPASRIKFHNFGVNSPGVNFYADDVKMTAISSTTGTESTTGTVYGGLGANGMYVVIAPGSHTLTGRIAATVDKDLPISNAATTIEDGKYYSYFQSGIYNATTKTIDAFVIEDPMPSGPVDYSVAQVRFVNAISNGTGDLNLIATNTTTTTDYPLGGATAYKSGSAFVAVPPGIYNLRAAYTGAGTNLITRNTLSFVGGRSYTIAARGSTATATTLALDFTLNQR